jgi:AcrR family transcriptional regulator
MAVARLRGGPAREAELLDAVLDVLRETGYERLTVDAVVARARASKQTVYRRWPSKADLVVAAFVNAVPTVLEPPDTGSLREDLLTLLDSLRQELNSLGDVIAGLIGELRRNSELASALRTGYVDSRAQALQTVFERARARAELTEDVDIELLWPLVPATLFFRSLVNNEPVDGELIRRLVDQVVLPLSTPSTRG